MQATPQGISKRQSRSRAGRPSGPFVCQKCNKSFSRIENLTRHTENHKANGKFGCDICQKRFTRSDILKRHSRIHTAEEIEERQALLKSTDADTTRHPCQPTYNDDQNEHVLPDIRLRQSYGIQGEPAESHTDNQNIISSSRGTFQSCQGAEHLTVCYNGQMQNGMNGLQGTIPQNAMMVPPPESGAFGSSWSDGYYGIYGEGSFDADLAWILDMAPMNFETIPRLQERIANTATVPEISDMSVDMRQLHPQQSIVNMSAGNHGDLIHRDQIRDLASAEDRNDWPDEDEPLGARHISEEQSACVIPDSRSWVDWDELSSPFERLHDTPVQSYRVDHNIRARLIQTLLDNALYKDGLLPPENSHFPDPEVLEYFLKLFFEHVQIRFPVIHQATFSTVKAPSFLLLSMMLLGSSHSRTGYGKFVAVYLRPIVTMFQRLQALGSTMLRSTDNMLTLLFLCVSGAWCGHKAAFEFAEGARGILVTASRRCKLLDCRPRPLLLDTQQPRSMRTRLNESWKNWILLEQRKRLGLCIFMFDLQFPALFHNQPYISKAETVNLVLPCDARFWEAKSAESWKVLLGPAEIPASTYFMVPLDTCLLYPAIKRDPPYAPIDSFSKTLLMYALFTHIFEWRQSLNIVLHSAFIRGPENTTPGEGLRERQRWLQDALDAWLKYYHQSDGDVRSGSSGAASPAALLLYCLAEIHLEINISDLHQFAGRSGSNEDIKLAEDSLRRWCQSPRSARIMQRVYEMLDLAHQTIESGHAHECAFEVAVALLTGGLTCWTYEKLGGQASSGTRLQLASEALERMTCWGICANFSLILKKFIF